MIKHYLTRYFYVLPSWKIYFFNHFFLCTLCVAVCYSANVRRPEFEIRSQLLSTTFCEQ